MSENRFSAGVSNVNISGIRKLFEAAGPNAINLGIGEPDFDTPDNIKKAAIQAITDGFTGYTAGLGIPELRNAICGKLERENKISVKNNEVMVTSGASEALYISMAALVSPGDEVLIPNPGFLAYNSIVRLLHGKDIGVNLKEDLTLDVSDVLEKITPKTKALVLNSPGNPTGAVSSKADIKALAEIADDKNITLISDEVYEYFIYDGEHVSPAQFSDNVITINAFSKSYAMTGWRIGYLAAKENYVGQILKVHQYLQACANSIAQKAAVEALTGPQESVVRMKTEFKSRRDVLVKGLNDIGLPCVMPKGAFYAFPEISECDKVAETLLKNDVVVTPGTAFGTRGKDHIRISYAASMEDIKKALTIMEKVL
ncbi:pyridoxal phosphate-dependent aminotransferase [Methanolapillus ohkumae]|uniref:Aspartate/prephenate aminotransferase n=1 Tax=Methanolapillus ohkumae TaxID=3028298 RepID=A0AA96ZVN0_9EURY|nr:Aspartate/prephenate aminotransferase [Methanosarcinaceae archaeon Am2]